MTARKVKAERPTTPPPTCSDCRMQFAKYSELRAHSLTSCTTRLEKLVADGKLQRG